MISLNEFTGMGNLTLLAISLVYSFCLLSEAHSQDDQDRPQWDARTMPLRKGHVAAVAELLNRLIPEYQNQFVLNLDPTLGPEFRDTFKLHSAGDKINVTGTSAIALSMGVHHYLKYFCKAHVSWSGNQLRIPQPLPKVDTPVTVTTQDKYRHYQNVCTVSYSMLWWDWSRWEKEIDWMALNGINLPLAFTAQEAIWRKVFLGYGFNDSEINEFFTGPAFLAWNRMGNVQGFGGPLPPTWHEQRITLQKQILKRMRHFGMNPIAPAFAGRVPPSFKRMFPKAQVTQNAAWSKFTPPFCCTSILDPEDPLFTEIGIEFLHQYKKEFGTDYFYSADLFNEMDPPTNDTDYLHKCGKAVFSAMTSVDKEAVWVMQGWIFVNDPSYWKPPQAKALLTSVPSGRMLVVDLEAEFHPQYQNFESFYGQPFIWSIIHNYGGVEGLYGSFDAINQGPFNARAFPNSSMIGTGITPEGIERNDIIYDLMNEMAWRDKPVVIEDWIYNFTERRYGKTDENITTGWKYLRRSVYNATGDFKNHGKYIFNTRPSISKSPYIWYNPKDLLQGVGYFMNDVTDPEIMKQETFRHDIVDFARQGYQILLDSLYLNLTAAYKNRNLQDTELFGRVIQLVLSDLEELLASDPRFTLSPWLASASTWATTPEEEMLYEYNARNQITLWGPNGEILDYANKQWSGVVKCYFKPRWELFVSMLRKSLILGTKFDQNEFNTMVLVFVEEPFSFGNCSDALTQTRDPVLLARQFALKYKAELKFLNDLRNVNRPRKGFRNSTRKAKGQKVENAKRELFRLSTTNRNFS